MNAQTIALVVTLLVLLGGGILACAMLLGSVLGAIYDAVGDRD